MSIIQNCLHKMLFNNKLFFLIGAFSIMASISALKCYRKNRDQNDTDARVEECPNGTKGCLAALGCAIPCMPIIDVRACTPYEDPCGDENKMNVTDKVVCDNCSVCHTDLCNGQGLFKIGTTEKPDSKEKITNLHFEKVLQCYVKGNVTNCPAEATGCLRIKDCSISVIREQEGCAMVEDPCNEKVSGDVTPCDFCTCRFCTTNLCNGQAGILLGSYRIDILMPILTIFLGVLLKILLVI